MEEEIKQEIILSAKTIFTTCAFIWLLCSGVTVGINLTGFIKYLGYFSSYLAGVCLYITIRRYLKMEKELVNYKLNKGEVSATN